MRRDASDGVINTRRSIFTLVGDMVTATQIVKFATGLHIGIRNFDRAEKMIAQAVLERPCLILLDLEKCEAEAFRALKGLRENADLKSVPAVGFVTQAKAMVKPEAEKGGCSRVYMKTEFGRELPNLIVRYAV